MKKLFILLAAMLTFTSTAFAQIGSLSSDLVYTPVTPCRIFDTRTSQGGSGPIPAGGTKNFAVWGVSSYAGQGGAASNCGIVAGANTAAVAVNLVVAFPSGTGWLTAYPFGTTMPLAATLNYNAGEVVVSNGAILKVAQGAATDLTVFSSANAEVIADVVGYYAKPVATALQCQDTTVVSVVITAGAQNNAFASACPAGYTQTSTNCTSNWPMPIVYASAGICSARNNGSVSETLSASRTCCRIPGR
jgi:hypothetical protein